MRLVVVLAVVVALITLAACGGDAGITTPTTTIGPTATLAPGQTTTPGPTATPTPGDTPGITPTATGSPTPTVPSGATPTATPTASATVGPTASPSPSATPTRPLATMTPTPTKTPIPTPTHTPTIIPTPTRVASTDPSSFPPFPNIYKGNVTIGGQPSPDGTLVFARIVDYQSPPVVVADGGYSNLVIGPPGDAYIGNPITFHAVVDGQEIMAQQGGIFVRAILGPPIQDFFHTLNLTFP